MPSKIGEAILVIKANAKGLKTGLDSAQKTVSSKLGKMEKRLQGFAGKIPIVGGELKGLGGPALVASAAIGIAVGAVAGMVKKTLDLGRSLGEAREKLGVSDEGIQIWRRAVEETNGKAGAFDNTVLRLQRSIGEAATGNKAYADDFDAIGLSWQDLETMSPEDALLAVLSATNDNLNASDGAAVKAGLLGRSYADMGGLANDSGADIQAMLDKVSDSAVVMGGDAVTSVDDYDAAMREMRDTIGKIAITVGTKLIPKITDAINGVQDMFNVVSPVLIPALKILGGVIDLSVIRPFVILKGAIVGVSQILKGDFSGAWNTAKETAVNALSGIVTIYNNTIGLMPGVAKIDMDKVRDAIGVVSDKANDDLNPALEDTKKVIEDSTQPTKDLATATGELADSHKTAADRINDTRQAIADKKQAADDAESALSGTVLPTLDELIATMAEEEEATDNAALATTDFKGDVIAFSEEGSEALSEFELAQARSYDNYQLKMEETALKAEELATRTKEAAKKAADDTKLEVDRINASWDGFITKQDDTIIAMDEAGVDFADIVKEMAKQNGISTVEMAQHYATLGVKYGDTLALIEAAGRASVDATLAALNRLKAEAAAVTASIGGGGGGSGGGGFNTGGSPLDNVAFQKIVGSVMRGETFEEAMARLTDPRQKWAEAIKALSPSQQRAAFAAAQNHFPSDQGHFPQTAHGGITNGPQIRQVGEGGEREAIIPLSKLPDLMSRMMGGGNGGRPQITIMGDVYGWDDWVDKVGEANIEIEERGG